MGRLLSRVVRRVALVVMLLVCATSLSVAAEAPSAAGSEALERSRRDAALRDSMQQFVGAGFTVSVDDPSGQALAPAALASLDRAYWRMGALLGVFPRRSIPVVLYTADDFADITRSPAWAAGIYDGTIRLPMRRALDNPAELDRVLAHEFAHALVSSLAPRGVPAWLNEGLATALESDDRRWERSLDSAPAPLSALTSSFSTLRADLVRPGYTTSARAVRRLLAEAGGVAVADLLRDLGDGVSFDVAFLRRMHVSLADFESGSSAF